MATLLRQGGIADSLDKRISRPLFHTSLPIGAELFLSIPSMWFGCIPFALGIVPVVIVIMVSDEQPVIVRVLAKTTLIIHCLWWARITGESTRDGSGFAKAYNAPSHVMRWAPHAVMAFAMFGDQVGVQAVALYYCSWFLTQLCCETVKIYFQRARPAVALASELDAVGRALPEVAALVRKPSQAYMAFPSSDAAGSAVFAVSLVASATSYVTREAIVLAVIAVLLVGFGRVYFHAHHVLDIIGGYLIGSACTAFVIFATHPGCSWVIVVVSQVMTLVLWPTLPTYEGMKTLQHSVTEAHDGQGLLKAAVSEVMKPKPE
mmetsp:Transcript_15891/g.25827  ORF Transcript_15891/g.25827 Transcript_15891/m.25827 type:complete len:319 (+) Transcript_15891:58-1014(+)